MLERPFFLARHGRVGLERHYSCSHQAHTGLRAGDTGTDYRGKRNQRQNHWQNLVHVTGPCLFVGK